MNKSTVEFDLATEVDQCQELSPEIEDEWSNISTASAYSQAVAFMGDMGFTTIIDSHDNTVSYSPAEVDQLFRDLCDELSNVHYTMLQIKREATCRS